MIRYLVSQLTVESTINNVEEKKELWFGPGLYSPLWSTQIGCVKYNEHNFQ